MLLQDSPRSVHRHATGRPLFRGGRRDAGCSRCAGTFLDHLAALLAGHVLQDGEVIPPILKPSLWFIVLSALRFVAVVVILMMAVALADGRMPGRESYYQELGLFVITGRMMWSVLQWMGRLYILTNLRIVARERRVCR